MSKELYHASTHFESEGEMALWAGKHVAFLVVAALFGFHAVGAGIAVYIALLSANFAYRRLYSDAALDNRDATERHDRSLV